MEILIVLAVVLTVVTLVGHGIWVAIAWLVRGGEPIKPTIRAPHPTHCPRCNTALWDKDCPLCYWPQDRVNPHARQQILETLWRQLARYHQLGMIDAQVFSQLQAVLSASAAPEQEPRTTAEVPIAEVATAASAAPSLDDQEAYQLAPRDEDIPVLAEVVSENAAQTPADVTLAMRMRAERFSQAAREAERPVEPVRPPRPPRRPWTDILSAFMEEKNIRWGELIGGLLIVCCSVALVISFWAKIAERPFLKFFVFNGVTAALFGLGLYSERRWKLRTTSDGLLITAMLLVPLNFLAIAAFSQGAESRMLLTIAGELVSIALFSVLLIVSGKTVVPQAVWPLGFGVMLPAVLQLLARRFVGPEPTWAAEGFGLAILGIYAAVNAAARWLPTGSRRFSTDETTNQPANIGRYAGDAHGYGAFKLLGITTFAAALACGFIVFKTEDISTAIHRFAPLACVAGLTPLAVGLGLWRRLTAPDSVAQRTAALAIAVGGALLLGAGVVLAWPTPALLLPSAALAALVLIAVAVLYQLPPAILAATVCVTLFYLVAVQCWRGELDLHANDAGEAARVLLSGTSGLLLTPFALCAAALAASLRFMRRSAESLYTGLSALGVAALSIALVSWFGFARLGDPLHATWIYAFYAALALAAALKLRDPRILHAGAALVLAAFLQGIVFWLRAHRTIELPWTTALLSTAGLLALVGLCLPTQALPRSRWSLRRHVNFDVELISPIALGLLCAALGLAEASLAAYSLRFAALAAVWLVLSLSTKSVGWFAAFQAILAVAASFFLASELEKQTWFEAARYPWFDPWTVAAEAILLAGMSLAWIVVRCCLRAAHQQRARVTVSPNTSDNLEQVDDSKELIAAHKTSLFSTLRALLDARWPRVDAVMLRVALAAAMGLAIYAALPGVAQELSPRTGNVATAVRVVPPLSACEIPGIDHDHARTAGTWLLLGLLAVGFVLETTVRRARWNAILLLLVAALVCPLLASHWQDDVATSSAMRWLSSGFLLVASIPIWCRTQIATLALRAGWRGAKDWARAERSIAGEVCGVFVLSLLPLAAMGAYVGGAAVWRTPPTADVAWLFMPLAVVFAVAGAIGLTLRATAATWVKTARTQTSLQRVSPRLTSLASHASSLLFLLGVAPLLAVTLYVVAAALKQSPILGPDPASWFFRVGLAVSYAVPVLVTALVLVVDAVRERSDRFALAGSLVCNVGVTAAYLLSITKYGLQFDATQWIRLAQLNAIASAAFALAWIAGLWWWSRRKHHETPRVGDLLITLVSLALALNLLVIFPTWLRIFLDGTLSIELQPVSDAWGWGAALLAGAALICVERLAAWPLVPARQLGKAFVLITLIACDIAWYGNTAWAALHALLVLHIALSLAIALAGWVLGRQAGSPRTRLVARLGLTPPPPLTVRDEATGAPEVQIAWRRQVSRFSTLASVIGVVLSLRLFWDDPQSPWWSIGGLLTTSALAVWLACWSSRRGLLYYAAPLLNIAVTAWWNETIWSAATATLRDTWLLEAWQINIAALALPAVLWMLLERRVFQAQSVEAIFSRIIPFNRLAARLATLMTALSIGLGLMIDSVHVQGGPPIWGQWLAVAATTIAATACLWDARARDAIALLYVSLLLWAGALLDSLTLEPPRLLWLGTIALAAHGLATSYLWSRRDGLRKLADQLHIPRAADNPLSQHAWLLPANCLLATLVVCMVFAIELTFADFTERLLVAKAVLIEAVAIGLLARGTRRTQLQYAALLLGAIGIVALGWSAIDPGSTGALLNRAVVVAAALAATIVLYGLGLTKLLKSDSQWLAAAQRLTPVLVAAAACALAFVLAAEGFLQATTHTVDMSYPAIAVVAAALLGLCAAALAAAVLPGRDPLGLSENGRKLYVYGAEVALALLFVHIRLTMPWLFHGFFERYWPLVVMFIAFVGAGVGEWLRRRQLVVVGEPLENTGALLPLLSVLGYWVLPANVDYSLLLLSVGLLYTGLSVTRKSFGFGVLAALAANGGLWYFLNRADGYRLVDHPQLWLIPPALCVLAAAHINRRQLSTAQMSAVRYATSVVVYVSSTADIFLNGVAEAPWLPFVLAGLSLVGIFAGIWMRVRAFLLLGTAFLVLALFTVIWHAAVNLEQTWLWAASGIVAGVIIIAVFAVFEKKRDTVLGMVDQLKRWE